MKKIISKKMFSVVFLFAMVFGFVPIESSANELMHDGDKKGSSEVVQNTDECPSGVSRMCFGDGSLCELTIGHDCTTS